MWRQSAFVKITDQKIVEKLSISCRKLKYQNTQKVKVKNRRQISLQILSKLKLISIYFPWNHRKLKIFRSFKGE